MTTTMNRQRHAAHRPTEGTTASLPARGSDPASAGAGSSLWLPDGQPSPAQFAAAVILADDVSKTREGTNGAVEAGVEGADAALGGAGTGGSPLGAGAAAAAFGRGVRRPFTGS